MPQDHAISRRSVLVLGAAAALAACSSPSPSAQGTSAPTTPGTRSAPGSASPPPTPSADPSASPRPTGAREVAHGSRTVPTVALTFHGAGDPRLAQQVLSTAEKAGVGVTVLAVGTWLQTYPEMGRRVLSGGHELGNHTLHHRPMRPMSEAAAYSEIVGGQREVRAYAAGPSWFRPSGTPHATPHILAAAARAGYRTSLSFDVDPRDYADPGAALVVSRVLAGARAGSIVSLHLGHLGTVDAMPQILRGLHGRGLAPVTVSKLLSGVSP